MSQLADIELVRLLAGVARSQLGHGVGVAAVDVTLPPAGLMPAEAEAVANAVASRRREFAAGRAAARAALAEIGVHGRAIPAGPDRAPVWPERTVGSITHTHRVALAAAGWMEQVQSIGLDLEPSAPLDEDLMDQVLTPTELARMAHLPPARRGELAKLIFSAKECAFKCQYPLTGAMLGFDALEIELDPAGKRFFAVAAGQPVRADPAERMTGRFTTLMGHVLTTMVLRR